MENIKVELTPWELNYLVALHGAGCSKRDEVHNLYHKFYVANNKKAIYSNDINYYEALTYVEAADKAMIPPLSPMEQSLVNNGFTQKGRGFNKDLYEKKINIGTLIVSATGGATWVEINSQMNLDMSKPTKTEEDLVCLLKVFGEK